MIFIWSLNDIWNECLISRFLLYGVSLYLHCFSPPFPWNLVTSPQKEQHLPPSINLHALFLICHTADKWTEAGLMKKDNILQRKEKMRLTQENLTATSEKGDDGGQSNRLCIEISFSVQLLHPEGPSGMSKTLLTWQHRSWWLTSPRYASRRTKQSSSL